MQHSGTLPWNINGSSSFCKGPRTSKVWKSKDPQGPRTLRLCMSEDLCKNYYSHLYFTVVTFLTKIQNWCYITKKLFKTQLSKKLDGKNYYCPKNLDGKNHYHPSFWLHDQKLGWEKPLPSKFLITWPKTWTVVGFPFHFFY